MRVLYGLLLAAALSNFSSVASSAAPQPKQAVASSEVQKEFAAFIQNFRDAVKSNDAKAVAGLSKIPFMSHTDMYGAAAFETKVYRKVFTSKTRNCIERSKAAYDRDGEKNDNYFISCGDEIFTFTKTPSGFLFTEIGAND